MERTAGARSARDAELTISVLGDGERSSSIDVSQLKPFKSYTLDLPLEGPGGWAAHVTVAAHDDASNVVYFLKPVLDLGPTKAPTGTAIAVAQLVPTACFIKVVRGTAAGAALVPRNIDRPQKTTPVTMILFVEDQPYTPEVAGGARRLGRPERGLRGRRRLLTGRLLRRRRGTGRPDAGARRLLCLGRAVVADGRRRRCIDGGRAPPLRLADRHVRRARTGRGAVAAAGDGADVGGGAVADALPTVARPDAGAAARRNHGMGGRDAETKRGRRTAATTATRVRRLADDLAAKQLAVQRLMMELEGRGDALRACGAEMAALRRRADQAAEKAKETLEAKVAEEEAKRTSDRRTFETLVAERSRGRSIDMSDPMAQLRAAASLCAQLKRENADLTEASKGATSAFFKLKDLQAEHAHLRRAHTQQAAYVRAYKTTARRPTPTGRRSACRKGSSRSSRTSCRMRCGSSRPAARRSSPRASRARTRRRTARPCACPLLYNIGTNGYPAGNSIA